MHDNVVNHNCLCFTRYTRSDTLGYACIHGCADNHHCSDVWGNLLCAAPQERRYYNVGCFASGYA